MTPVRGSVQGMPSSWQMRRATSYSRGSSLHMGALQVTRAADRLRLQNRLFGSHPPIHPSQDGA